MWLPHTALDVRRWRTRVRLASALVFGALLAGSPPHARAFERSKVDGDPDTALFWRFRTVPLRPAYDSAVGVSAPEAEAAVARSIDAWNRGGEGCSDLFLRDDGPPASLLTTLDGGEHDGVNRIRWRSDGWPEELGPDTLAITTTVYRRASGQILDADVDLNGVDHVWAARDVPAALEVDIENTLTHELGHLIGLAHVSDPEATMNAESLPGDIAKRTLSEDELDAICSVYPRGSPSPGAPIFQAQPLTSSCAAGAAGSRPPGLIFLGLLLGLLRLRRRPAARGSALRPGRACGST